MCAEPPPSSLLPRISLLEHFVKKRRMRVCGMVGRGRFVFSEEASPLWRWIGKRLLCVSECERGRGGRDYGAGCEKARGGHLSVAHAFASLCASVCFPLRRCTPAGRTGASTTLRSMDIHGALACAMMEVLRQRNELGTPFFTLLSLSFSRCLSAPPSQTRTFPLRISWEK